MLDNDLVDSSNIVDLAKVRKLKQWNDAISDVKEWVIEWVSWTIFSISWEEVWKETIDWIIKNVWNTMALFRRQVSYLDFWRAIKTLNVVRKYLNEKSWLLEWTDIEKTIDINWEFMKLWFKMFEDSVQSDPKSKDLGKKIEDYLRTIFEALGIDLSKSYSTDTEEWRLIQILRPSLVKTINLIANYVKFPWKLDELSKIMENVSWKKENIMFLLSIAEYLKYLMREEINGNNDNGVKSRIIEICELIRSNANSDLWIIRVIWEAFNLYENKKRTRN